MEKSKTREYFISNEIYIKKKKKIIGKLHIKVGPWCDGKCPLTKHYGLVWEEGIE